MELKLITPRICSCGKLHDVIPNDHKTTTGDFDGVWFDCDECNTTLFTPIHKIELIQISA